MCKRPLSLEGQYIVTRAHDEYLLHAKRHGCGTSTQRAQRFDCIPARVHMRAALTGLGMSVTLAGLEPAIFASEERRLIH